ncbi:hypothetical protein CLUG_04053 [Clavispora lusitaniae ATCC 42720]|uniref:Reticulon-like protein n=1 Tax=Clavispora lusitaniae (strain ATCC 42720) TaxID=306902 RepID=C4Y7B9_CLAL4|nr:uncharacterized protein CLUG_04053 [Clavispora lusitaniae ATCC 42720]EEQ39925.1 hypothetical protein CLUG_04053 [Clavispora lusitaniae ATCC 42720]
MSTPAQTPIVQSSSATSLLTWKDPVATGKVFGAIIGALLLVKINVANHFFHLAYIGLLAAAAAEYAGKLVTGQGFVTKYVGTPKSHSKVFKESVLPALADASECAEKRLHKIIFAQDIEATLKAAGAAYILFKLTSWFSVYSLIFTSVLLTFSVPLVYQSNKKEIDAAVAQYSKIAKEKSAEYTKIAHDKAAPHIDAFIKKSGPVGNFIQSKFSTRTAGSTVGAKPAQEPATGYSSGSSQFPDVPSAAPSSISEVVDETFVDKTQLPEESHL